MAIRRTAGLIIENAQGELLLMLRDDKPTIPFPNQWSTIGGHIEPGETPEEAIKREAKEELCFEFNDVRFFRTFHLPEEDGENENHTFFVRGPYVLEDFHLQEGQEIRFFKESDLRRIKIGFRLQEVLDAYMTERRLGRLPQEGPL